MEASVLVALAGHHLRVEALHRQNIDSIAQYLKALFMQNKCSLTAHTFWQTIHHQPLIWMIPTEMRLDLTS